MANLKDFATGTVSSAPSPATTGTQLTLQAGEGARMPAVPFWATAHPDYQLPTLDNAEKILVTAISTDTLTITRAQGDTTAKSIAIGWRISNAVFAADLINMSLVVGETPGGSVNGSNTTFTTLVGYTTGSLKVYLNGQRLTAGASNDYTETSTGFTMNYAPATGDVLVVDYNVGSETYSDGVNSHISDETPAGTVDGSNTSFTTAHSYVAGTLEVFINGLKQARGTHVTESTPSTGAFTLDVAPTTGDVVRVNYQHSVSAGGNADTVDGYHANTTPTANQIPVLNSRAQTGEWYEEIGRHTLTVAGDTMTVNNLPVKKYLKVISYQLPTGGSVSGQIVFNNDTNSLSYNRRVSDNHAASAASAGAALYLTDQATATLQHTVTEIVNVAGQNKLIISNGIADAGDGVGPTVRELLGQWENSTDAITRIDLINGGTGDFAIGSELIVLGHD